MVVELQRIGRQQHLEDRGDRDADRRFGGVELSPGVDAELREHHDGRARAERDRDVAHGADVVEQRGGDQPVVWA